MTYVNFDKIFASIKSAIGIEHACKHCGYDMSNYVVSSNECVDCLIQQAKQQLNEIA